MPRSPARDRERHLATYPDPHHRARHLLCNARARARTHGLECSLTQDWIKARLLVGLCEVSGLPFVLNGGARGKGQQHPWAPSLDRINPLQGYTPANTRVVVWLYNACKHVSTHDNVLTLAWALTKQPATQ